MERPTVVIELADDPKLARDISAGGVFVPGCTLKFNSDCTLLVRGATEEIELHARVVYVDLNTGAGLELVGFTPAMRDHLTGLMTSWNDPARVSQAEPAPEPEEASFDEAPVDEAPVEAPLEASFDEAAVDEAPLHEARLEASFDEVPLDEAPVDEARLEASFDEAPFDEAPVEAAPPLDDEPLDLGFDPEALAPSEAKEDAELTDEEQADPAKRSKALSLHQRLRGLTLAQAIKHATSPDPQERILLERYYGKSVWEPLLRNPRLTPPEVARIARMGTLPRTMIEIIVSNGAWLQIPEIRRALLNNPRLGTDQILRVLRLMPKPELKLASTQTVYPYAVRDAAKRLMKEQGGG